MKLAINQFLDGLQLDTHPMVQSASSLSDALNATYITMNGNEVVLQNDMGNRKVDNAYLPPGYEPVGIKEYGGIIYVAAYNPITNKSLIGSFPSPERRINSLDNNGLGGNLDLFLLNIGSEVNGLHYLALDTILIPLTSDTSLHAGDKFVIYTTNDLKLDKEEITNFDNVDTEEVKVISPKNKKYTLSLGILNSQNEFVDITKSLVRWHLNSENEPEIMNFDNVSDLFKFNSGYFIAPGLPSEIQDQTQDDAKLIQKRQTFPANTYAYKLTGPLYLKLKLNHIESFNYNIYGIKNSQKNSSENDSYTLWIESYITYNCPDNIKSTTLESDNIESTTTLESDNKDENYITYDEILPNFKVFDLYLENSLITDKNDEFDLSKYDSNTNLYTCKLVTKYLNIVPNEDGIFKYTIGVNSGLVDKDKNELYLNNLSDVGQINLNLLGTNSVKMKAWRFINNFNSKESTITYKFEAYSEYGTHYDNFKFIFTPYDSKGNLDELNHIKIESELYNGKSELYIDWNLLNLTPRTLYQVKWIYDIVYDNGKIKENSITSEETRWFLTTELFNSCYNQSSENYISDYGNYNAMTSKEKETLENLLTVKYTIESNLDGYTSDKTESSEGQLLVKNNEDITLKYTTELEVKINLNYTASFDENLYPNFITINPLENIIKEVVITKDNNTSEIGWEKKLGTGTISLPEFIVNTHTPKLITGKVKNYDCFWAKGTNLNRYIINGFIGFNDYLSEYISEFEKLDSFKYAGVMLDYASRTGPDDGHFVHFIKSKTDTGMKLYAKGSIDTKDTSVTANRIAEKYDDDPVEFKYDDVKSGILDSFNTLDSKILFTWGWGDSESHLYPQFNNDKKYGDPASFPGVKHIRNYCRVWWRTSFGDWAVFPNLFLRQANDIKTFILNNTKIPDVHFAYYKHENLSDLKLYAPDPQNYDRSEIYSLPFDIHWKLSFKENSTIINIPNEELPINFELEKIENEIGTYTVNISSSDTFANAISVALLNEIENIDLDGNILDYNNLPLNPNNLYLKNNNRLVYYSSNNIAVSDIYGGGKRSIVYNLLTTGAPDEKFDSCGDDHDDQTSLNYTGVNVVKL